MRRATVPAPPPVRQARRIRYLGLALCLAATAAHAVTARAQAPPSAGGWWTLELPGGTAGLLSAAGLDPGRPRTTALLDVIRVVHELRPGLSPAVDERRAALASYLDTLNQFLAARDALPPGSFLARTPANATNKKSLKLLAPAVGASLQQQSSSYALQPISGKLEDQRRAWLKAAGVDVERLLSDFNAGRPVRLDLRSDLVPLPAPPAAWRSLSGLADGFLARAILLDQHAAWMYYGLCGMDEETRRYLGANPQLLARIHDSDRAAVVALQGGSLHVRAGRIEPPGGEPAVRLWESVAGTAVSDPGRFILAVLNKTRLAHLYDAADRMDGPSQAFTLGLWMTDPEQRLERFKALCDASAGALLAWDPVTRPFVRGAYDPGHLLLASSVQADGRPGSLGWLTFWEKAFAGESLPSKPGDDLKDVEQHGPLDAASLVRAVGTLSSRTRRELCEAWCFGQRLFAKVPRESLPDVLVTLRGYSRYSVVSLTLERLGISDPAVHAAAVIRADQIARIGDEDRAAVALGLHQGALALIERSRLARTLNVPTAARLVASLNRVPFSPDGEFLGSVTTWIDAEYLPAIGGGRAQDADAQVLGALAGRRHGAAAADRQVEYEGARYVVDPSHGELARLRTIREKQGGAPLEAVLALAREVHRLSDGVPAVAQLPDRIARLRAAAQTVVNAQPRAPAGWSRHADLEAALRDALGDLSGIRKPQDLKKVDRAALILRRAADWELARVLASLAYAASIGDPDSTALVAGDPSVLHDWGLGSVDESQRARMEWSVPREAHDVDGRWRVEGSLLALDLGLGTETLRRLSSDAPMTAPTVSDNHRRALTEAAVLSNAFDYADEDLALLAGAIERGRARVAALAADASQLAGVAEEAGLDTSRRALLSWVILREQERVPQFFSLGDLLRLGRLDRAAVRNLDAWGTSGRSYDGRLCLRFPLVQPAIALSGRWSQGVMPTLVPDLSLLIAEALHQRNLPAVLARSMLLVATPDYLDRVAPAHEDDWLTLVSDVQRILPQRIDDYLASVTTGGPLVPLRQPNGGARD